jgi:single-stranded-DNA-specific exonuclease
MKTASIKKIDSGSIGFQIGPRLNAAGRMKTAEIALEILNTKSGAEAAKLSLELEGLNGERKRVQSSAVKEIAERGIGDERVIVQCGEWHEGVLGIIAGRLVEEYGRPAFVLSEVEDGVLKGSGRSFGDFNLKAALDNCADVIIGGGGHAEACGIKVEKSRLDDFVAKVNEYYDSLKLVDQDRFLRQKIDLTVRSLDDFTIDLIDDLKLLEPFGEGNSEPVFRLENATIIEKKRMGAEGQHLALVVKGEGSRALKLLAFSAKNDWMNYNEGDNCDVTFRVIENEWNGVRSIEGQLLNIVDNFAM